jgi:osmotically inducible protein OsmC
VELLAAAHAACFSMALSFGLANSGHPPERLETTARARFQAGQGITGVQLSVRGRVPGLDAGAFREAAQSAEETCPVSKALAGVQITLAEAELV